jgi:dTDP-4-amino-4,6-dideoxygalactose transaminase
VENREAVQAELAKQNIDTGIHYPVPLHLQKAYSNFGYGPGDFPVCENAAKRILSLPMFPGLTEADQVRVVEALVRSAQNTRRQDVLAV